MESMPEAAGGHLSSGTARLLDCAARARAAAPSSSTMQARGPMRGKITESRPVKSRARVREKVYHEGLKGYM